VASLVLSVLLTTSFFVWEARLDEVLAALPPKVWSYPNVPILLAVGLQPFMFYSSVQLLFSWVYQEIYHWTAMNTAVHFLPLGIMSFIAVIAARLLQQRLKAKNVILLGELLVLSGALLLPFSSTAARYWSFAFPGFCLSSIGMTVVFTTINIELFAGTPPQMAGTIGATFNCALQLGTAMGSAIVVSIQSSIDSSNGSSVQQFSFVGRAAALWFLVTVTVIEGVMVWIFMHTAGSVIPSPAQSPDIVEVLA